MTQRHLSLPTTIDSATVAELRNGLLDLRGAELSIDASAVQKIGGLGLQVLLAAARLWRADGLPFAIANRSTSFNDMLRLTGAAELPEFAQ